MNLRSNFNKIFGKSGLMNKKVKKTTVKKAKIKKALPTKAGKPARMARKGC